MAEDYPEFRPDSPWPEFEKAQLCLDGVRQSECFVAIITRRHGTPISFGDAGLVPSSFFEAELFEAALLEKPAFIFLLKDYEPDAKLANLLKLLGPFFPDMNLQPMSEDEIVRQIERLIAHYRRPKWLRRSLARPRASQAFHRLFKYRHSPYDVRAKPPPLRFLDGSFDPVLQSPDPQLVQAVLDRAAKEQNHNLRLTLLWFAIRALMGAPFTDPKSAGLLHLWERALGAWNSTGAWYGMHGHTTIGCLATLGSLAEVRSRQGSDFNSSGDIPHGAIASEYYSIARLAGRSAELLTLSLRHIEAALAVDGDQPAGYLAIRGSIYREMGLREAALADYSRVAELRRDLGDASYGEALSELGYAFVRFSDLRRGIALMEQGVALLSKVPASGFRVRAIRKLAVGYARCGKLPSALDCAVEAHAMATQIGALDQIRTLDRLALRIDSLRRWRP